MKIKSIFASVAACALAVSAMAVTASADALMTMKNGDSTQLYDVDFTGVDATLVDKIEVSITVDSGYVNGCIGVNYDGDWKAENQETSGDGEITDTWVYEGLAGHLDSEEPFAQVQFWWVNPKYDEGGNAIADTGVATLNSITLYDASGNELSAAGESAETTTAAEGTTTAAEGTTTAAADDSSSSSTTKAAATTAAASTTKAAATTAAASTTKADGSKTGDAGVGVAVATLALASTAAFLARKKH